MITLQVRRFRDKQNSQETVETVKEIWTDQAVFGGIDLFMSCDGMGYGVLQFNFQTPRDNEHDPKNPNYELRISHNMLRDMVKEAQRVGFVLDVNMD